ncbi:MAG: DegT/DnrJ/EryC1/StrS aminotransferase family protein [Burkholderiales bacterium]|nr:DegT/DnrJ/EryC1/StrS aminotransferase family protein [Burkholderiales bacterium]
MLDTPFSPWPAYSAEEIEAVSRVLASGRVNYWTGQECREFEREFAAWCGTAHAVALANGTLALDAALRALDIGRGDDVIVTPRSFMASASCVVNAGARPVFADVDLDSGNLTAETVRAVLTPATKAVLCVHLAGWPCEMDSLLELCRERGLKLIEDCAQANGARYRGANVGTFGDIGAWSFCQDKIITTGGEGGMVTTHDKGLWSRMWSLKDHGKSFDAVYERRHAPGFRWLHESFGHNWRMLEVQAAIGRIQLRRLAAWSARRRVIAAHIADTCRRFDALRVPQVPAHIEHACYRQYAYVRPERLKSGWSRDRIVEAVLAERVPLYHGSCSEIYLERAFDGTGARPAERLRNARALGETSLMFLVHPTLTEAEVERTCAAVEKVMSQASR